MPSMLKIALPALAAAHQAYAACSATATLTIQNAGDATALASCSTFSGSIAIETGTSDDIAINGVKKITGDLIATANSNIKQISASDLTELDGQMHLDGLTSLYAINFPKLKTVDSIKWNALPNLQEIGFGAEVTSAKNIDIQNTALRSLKGINIEEVEEVFIANNGYIDTISMQLGNVSKSLTLADNNEAVKVELPNLIWASNLTFRFCGSVSVPSLETLNGSLGLYNNGFESFTAPNLTSVGEAVALVANENLSNVSFPQLTKITDNLQIANNSKLIEVDGFPKLKSIGGAFDMSGNFTSVKTPVLDSVKGAFNLQSTDNVTETCAFYQPLKSKKLIQGGYKCEGKLIDPAGEGHTGTKQGGSNGKTGAATTLSAVNGALGLAAMAAIVLF
ncbi:GPI-anchored cell wall organization protein Ecm33 [Pyrenophora tritici-repentis]|uniref:GPI-anchored cell wall organization protein Ecm33 n=2 Tax=Pyrenophora tritici-repentis TaxID=45151 RepID=A0A2W1FKV7_9PLEO|nr:GPI-anchored cell wall organization protein Ecm33 [Pyrenophora tritici-repentis Pt-1C-BFP]KAA8619510.1 GPI-anchored cell wall organization protein Ecm33 [Pyrenophora tritici-repentis]EDU47234.1 GPI-anchored cell wall organization protein Ecm33 [Pyrenophora tritici-repentis Pt-1C-BFP]KAF7447654.1 GPI-anchored cell wall organization protein Ecm33 [Pyrenophora tritici-repentis]KAF7571342.1 Tymo-45kd-70kd multi-domain protein [Pyrenophora tritici-repentis]KAG9385421.1 GPI-anchored cell wall org